MRCVVTGAYGFLGATLCDLLEQRGHDVFRTGRRDGAQERVDPGDAEAFSRVLGACRPDVVVNLIAMTNVDDCERDPGTAFRVNAGVVHSIGVALQSNSPVRLVHISTDQVYGGAGPHVESAVAPMNVYAITKLAGELMAEKLEATILRVNFVGRSRSPGRVGLTDWLVQSLRDGREITLFDDVFFSPLHVESLSDVIERVVMRPVPGVFNVGSRGGISKAEFGVHLARRLALSREHVTVGSVASSVMVARRPNDMVMNSTRFEQAFDYVLPSIDNEIARVAADYSIGQEGGA